MPTGLRERKKQKTKMAIADAAIELFASKGFEETTVAEIAEAADVSPRTFFTYFPTKEDVVFCKQQENGLQGMRERLTERRPGESAVDALLGWINDQIADPEYSDAAAVQHRRLVRETPALAAYEVAHIDPEFQEILAEAVAADLDAEPTDVAPRMVAASASAALRAIVDYFADSDAGHDPEQLLEQAALFLDAGLGALSPDRD